LESCPTTTSILGSCLNTTSGLVPKPDSRHRLLESRPPTSGLHRLYKPDTVTKLTGKSPLDFLETAWNRFFDVDSRPPPLVQPDRRPVMGNGVSSQRNLPSYDKRDVGSSVVEEQHDWQAEQAVAPKPETLSLQQTRKSYN